MSDEFDDNDIENHDPFGRDEADNPQSSGEDDAGDPGDAGESEDMSTDSTIAKVTETVKSKARKGKKTADVKAAKKAVPAPKTGKKAPSIPLKVVPTPKAPAAQPKRSVAAKAPDPDRVFLMRGPAILLRQIGDPTRAAVIDLLADGPLNVSEICSSLGGLSQPAVSHHLALLRHARIISPTRRGKNNIYDLESVGRDLARIIRTLSA